MESLGAKILIIAIDNIVYGDWVNLNASYRSFPEFEILLTQLLST